MKQPTFHGRVLLPLSVFADARAGDPLAMERILFSLIINKSSFILFSYICIILIFKIFRIIVLKI